MCECKVCNVSKVRIDAGKRSGCSGRYKVDGGGRRWNGLVCPDCRSDQVGIRSNEKRADFGPTDVLYPPKLRRCPSCASMSANYFKCPACTSHAMEAGCLDSVHLVVDEPMLGRVNTKAGFRY